MIIQDKYKLIEKIGCGKFSNVFIANHIVKNTRVAIKFDHDEISKHLLKNEINVYLSILKNDKQPNFINIKSFGVIEKHNFIVMEYIPKTIEMYVCENNKTKLLSSCDILKKLIDAVTYLHNFGYVHRDLKPDNILVKNNEILLIDLGMTTKENNNYLTNFIGNPMFSSFNVHLSKYIYTKKDDIISCFYIIFYLFSDRLLPWSETFQHKINNHKTIYEKKTKTNFRMFYQSFDCLLDAIALYKKYIKNMY